MGSHEICRFPIGVLIDHPSLTVSNGGSIFQVWCSSIQGIYAQLTGGVNLLWVYVHCSIIYICHYMCQVWCSSIQGIYAGLEGVNLLWVYVHCAIYETYLV